jgi:hypothetical protein
VTIDRCLEILQQEFDAFESMPDPKSARSSKSAGRSGGGEAITPGSNVSAPVVAAPSTAERPKEIIFTKAIYDVSQQQLLLP